MPARLHREVIGEGRLLLLTHGIYGSGANWRAIARKVHEQRRDWGIVLVDLRQHGRSEPGEPPHTLAACASDLRALFDELPAIEAIGGHSFGGKVVLATRALAPPTLRQTWMFDASPSARPGAERDRTNTVIGVLEIMERLPTTWASRDNYIAALSGEGLAQPLAQWLAMNVVPRDDRYVLRLDVKALREMLVDYYARDLWDIAFDPQLPGELHVVIAEQSTTLDADDRNRLASAPPPHVHVHRIAAGHWLHIEAAANVVELLVRELPTTLR